LKTISHFPVIPVILFLLLWNNSPAFSQLYIDALRNKLSISDQNKLPEADALEAKGLAIFSGSQNISDLSIMKDQGAQKTKAKNITVFDLNHLDASVFFLYSNELFYVKGVDIKFHNIVM
jgi:hypothetical protein